MEFFDALSKAIGPVGALFAISTGYLYNRINTLQDKILASFVADTEMKAEMKNALENLTKAVEDRK